METTVKERPILFSAEMVRAILAGRKTQTRRVVDLRRLTHPVSWVGWSVRNDGLNGWVAEWNTPAVADLPAETNESTDLRCPYGVPGDRLWVRETFQIVTTHRITEDESWFRDSWPGVPVDRPHMESIKNRMHSVVWRADGEMQYGSGEQLTWRSPIFMPRWASRLTLEVTEVRVQRVQDIADQVGWDDVRAEGVACPLSRHIQHPEECVGYCKALVEKFSETWDKLNAKRGFGWDANPWVWAITFRPVERNPAA